MSQQFSEVDKSRYLTKSRIVVLPADVRSQEAFITACLSWSEFSRVGFYRKMAVMTEGNVPFSLPRFNRMELIHTDPLEIRAGDVVEGMCWYAKEVSGRAFEVHTELYHNGKLFCKLELVRAWIEKGMAEEKAKLRKAIIEDFGQYSLTPIDMNVKLEKENIAVRTLSVCLSDLDSLDHVNMAMYAQLFLNVVPNELLQCWSIRRCDIDYIREVPRNSKIELSLNTTVDGAYMLYIRNQNGQILNRMRVEAVLNKEPRLRLLRSVSPVPLLLPVRYEQSCAAAAYANWIMESFAFCMLQHPSKPNLEALLASGVHFQIHTCPNYSSVIAGRFGEHYKLEMWNIDVEEPVYTCMVGQTLSVGSNNPTGRNGVYVPEFRTEFMTHDGRFHLPRLFSLALNAKDNILPDLSNQGNHDKPFTERATTYKTDLWFEEISVQTFPELHLINDWPHKSSALSIHCAEYSEATMFTFFFGETKLAHVTALHAKPDAAFMTFNPFAFSCSSHFGFAGRPIEGQIDKVEEVELYKTFWASKSKL